MQDHWGHETAVTPHHLHLHRRSPRLAGDLIHEARWRAAHAAVAQRFGDVVVAMRDDYIMINNVDKEKELRLLGRHGGMTAAEMEAIWLGFRMDGG